MPARRSELDSFGAAVRRLRTARGLTQDDLADRAQTHRNYVGMLERGERNPTLLVILRLASALEADPGELVRAAIRDPE